MAQSVIVRGEDRTLVLRMVFRESAEPFDLANWSKITVQFRKADRTLLSLASDGLCGGGAAFALYEGVTYTASVIGVVGNSISLVFDGIKDIATVISDWNTANPGNQVTSDAADDTVVPTAGTVNLAEGVNQTPCVEVVNETLGKISVRLTETDSAALKTGPNQSFKVLVDKGAHPNGERRVVLFDSALNVIDADI